MTGAPWTAVVLGCPRGAFGRRACESALARAFERDATAEREQCREPPGVARDGLARAVAARCEVHQPDSSGFGIGEQQQMILVPAERDGASEAEQVRESGEHLGAGRGGAPECGEGLEIDLTGVGPALVGRAVVEIGSIVAPHPNDLRAEPRGAQ